MPEEEKVQDYVFTFGHDHVWPPTGKTLFQNYVVLKGTYMGTRLEMIRRFGINWSHQYSGVEAKKNITRYKLTEIRLEHEKTEYVSP